MSSFPKTYEVVRAGSAQTTTVNSVEALLELRTELELVLQFGEGATHDEITALDEQLRTFSGETSEDLVRQDNLVDMRTILADALDPANARATQAIDADFPEIKEALDMGSIKKEKHKFRKEVNEQLDIAPATTGDEANVQLGATADSDVEIPATLPAGESPNFDETLAEADSLINELLAVEPAANPSTDDPTAFPAETADTTESSVDPQAAADPEFGAETATSAENPDPEAITTLMEQLAADADSAESSDGVADLVDTSPEEAAATLLATQADMNDIADSLEAAVDGLAELNEVVRNVPNPAPAAETKNAMAEFEASDSSDPSGEPVDDDAAFEAMAAELDAAVNAPDQPEEASEPTAGIDLVPEPANAVEPAATPELTATPEALVEAAPQIDDQPEMAAESAPVEANEAPSTIETSLPAAEPPELVATGCDVGDMRRQLDDVKNTLTAQIDRLGDLMERSVTMQDTVRNAMQQAARFRAAANQATEASRRFETAQAAAEEARAAYEAAQARVAETRREWEAAQHAAASVAEQFSPMSC